MLTWKLITLTLPLKFTWKISRGSTNLKKNYLVEVTDGLDFAYGEIAGITSQEAANSIVENEFNSLDLSKVQSLEDLDQFKISSPVRFGLESALIHLESAQTNLSVADFFGLRNLSTIPTSFSLPILPLSEIEEFVLKNKVTKFPACKIKV